ncbi:MAG: hypothetical protein Q4D61_04250 [Cardiobacteriaceae bacterium]|nr:hypothetical protein [Cardiobacteriaceae bacterium]
MKKTLLTLCALLALPLNAKTPSAETPDWRIAAEFADRYGLPHLIVIIPPALDDAALIAAAETIAATDSRQVLFYDSDEKLDALIAYFNGAEAAPGLLEWAVEHFIAKTELMIAPPAQGGGRFLQLTHQIKGGQPLVYLPCTQPDKRIGCTRDAPATQ